MSNPSRRSFCGGLTAGLVSPTLLSSPASALTVADWNDPVKRLNAMVRIMGRTDGGVGIRWTDGVLSGVVEQETTQILGVSQQIYTRFIARDDGSYDATYLELVYFTALESGEVLEDWDNPYTGRVTQVPAQVLGPARFYLPLELQVVNEPFPMEGIENSHWFEPQPLSAEDVMFNERIDSYVPPMVENGAPLKFHEVFSFRASRQALEDETLTSVPATIDKVNVISWRPWMDMDEIDGVSMSRGAGRTITDYDALPKHLAEKNEKFFPDVVAEIEDYLEM